MAPIIKSRVRSGFDHGAKEYATAAVLQNQTAANLARWALALCPKGGMALDIGCGPGALSEKLAESGNFGRIVAVDISSAMTLAAREKLSKYRCVSIVQGDAEALPVKAGSCDIAVSNMVFQWLPDLKSAFSGIQSALKNKGRAEIVYLGENTFAEIRDAALSALANAGKKGSAGIFHPFPRQADVAKAARDAGLLPLETTSSIHTLEYRSVREMMLQLKMQGVQNNIGLSALGLGRRGVMASFAEEYAAMFGADGGIRLTYHVVRLSAVKQ
ncbi:MAG: methyltransferase domain-containing protein [Nitrospinae bacterium]|nr:methyltransferase domain-containing protein [Nitrospinota bacterium]